MLIAAIDPSLTKAGFAFISEAGAIAFGHAELRTAAQVEALVATIASYEPEVVGIENTFISVNAKTGIDLAELRGRLRQALETRGMAVQLVAPATWRKTTIKPPAKTKRKALKAMAVSYALQVYGLTATDDEADAICIATHLRTSR